MIIKQGKLTPTIAWKLPTLGLDKNIVLEYRRISFIACTNQIRKYHRINESLINKVGDIFDEIDEN